MTFLQLLLFYTMVHYALSRSPRSLLNRKNKTMHLVDGLVEIYKSLVEIYKSLVEIYKSLVEIYKSLVE
jgi:hypothetical protein